MEVDEEEEEERGFRPWRGFRPGSCCDLPIEGP